MSKSQPIASSRSVLPRESIAFARNRFHGPKAVGSFLPGLTTKALQKYGFSAASLIMDWPSIVGSEIARSAVPERLKWPRTSEIVEHEAEAEPPSRRSGAVLVLRVESAKALDVQYSASRIIERINAYFGYAAVAQLRLIQAPMPPAAPQRQARTRPEPLTREVASVGDAKLRDALARLGAEIRTAR
jgi:hypothetical protein